MFGEIIKKLRTAHNLSQVQLATGRTALHRSHRANGLTVGACPADYP